MYKVNGEQCKKCGKLFHPNAKVFRPIDSNGNPLEMELCDACEWDDMVEDVIKVRHISHEEAEKFLYGKMNKALDNIEPYHNIADVMAYDNWIRQLTNKKITTSNPIKKQGFRYAPDEVPNAVVRMVKDNE